MGKCDLTAITKTLCDAIGIDSPQFATKSIEQTQTYLQSKTQTGKVDKIVIFNPDAIGEWIFEKYKNLMPDIASCEHQIQMRSMIPPKTPVCFASIYTGATPEQHGINHYEKRKITIDSFFDALARANKKVCIVSVKNQSMDILFRDRNIDYFSLKNDKEVVAKTLQLIEQNEYDVICAYNQEYDDIMHRTHPKSFLAKRALKHYNNSFAQIKNAVIQNYKNQNTLLACITDHGVHREWFGLGSHGKDIDKDMNIIHFYQVL